MNEDTTVEQVSKQLEQLVKPLSNPLRIRLLILLSEGPISYSDILEHLQIESGSFYWHLKKMQHLVKQTGDKQYYLSELGETAKNLVLPKQTVNIPEDPKYFSKILTLSGKLHNLPSWIIVQQLLLLILLTTIVFTQQGLLQLGTIVVYNTFATFSDVLLSIIVSLFGISIMQILAIKIYDVLFLQQSSIPLLQLLKFYFEDLLILGNLLILGLISALILWIQPETTLISNTLYLVIVSSVSILLTILLSTGLIIENLAIDERDALILQLVIFYPILLVTQLFL